MYLFRILLLALLVIAPAAAFAAGMDVPQSVEEPDAPDDDSGMQPPEEEPVAPIPQDAPKPMPDVKSPAIPGEGGDISFDMVKLQGLNKVTARAQTIEAPIGSVVRFGTIEIVAHSCWKAAADERPENAALLEISEVKQGEAPTQIFLGWMFSSTPGISALEHPFYDVTVIACEKREVEKPATKSSKKK
jgi:hypothetical protein